MPNESWIEDLFDRLFPLNRSITGPGLRESLKILSEHVPLEVLSVPSGTEVFDWTVPPEWRIREAWLEGPDGTRIVDFADHNLHVVNYSAPVNARLTLDELKKHLHTAPRLPDAIPYVTSYYRRRWGFCLPLSTYEKLQPGEYHAYIDSEFVDGEINLAHAFLEGETKREVLISTYICHPSMANNELSGPIVASMLFNRLARWKRRRFTYRFVFAPETVGSLTYLMLYGSELVRSVHSGLVLTCLGGPNTLSYKRSRRGDAPIDRVVEGLFAAGSPPGRLRPFTPTSGSDERQYCSPGFNLPVGQMARTVYGEYPEYHTSLDNKDFMTLEALRKSADEIELVLKALELEGYYVNLRPYGEPHLSKRDLYPDMNSRENRAHSTNTLADGRVQLKRILTVLNYADGEHLLTDIAKRANCTVLELADVITRLQRVGLLSGPFDEAMPLERWKG